MKQVSISACDLFKGEAVGGLEIKDWKDYFYGWLALSDEERLKQRLSFIASRAKTLVETACRPDSGMPGNVAGEAQLLQQTAISALQAVNARDFLAASTLALDSGRIMAEVNGLLSTYKRLKVIASVGQINAQNAKKKLGTRSPLTVAIVEMARSIPDCSYTDLLTEIEADAKGQECLPYNLREQGLIAVKFTSVTAEKIHYDVMNGASGKILAVRSLHNKLAEVKKAKS